MTKIAKLKPAAALILATLLLAFAFKARSPFLHRVRPLLPVALISAGLVAGIAMRRRSTVRYVVAGMAGAAVVVGLTHELRFESQRERVMRSDPASLERLGRHLIVGFEDFASLAPLVEKGAVGGVFLAPHNVAGRSVEEVRSEIDRLQTLRSTAGLPPLLVMADQEGGRISRLSPPLPHLPPLSGVALLARDDAERETLAFAYGMVQGEGLRAMGITMNLGPVVDLPDEHSSPLLDPYSRISSRAISRDPQVVEIIARAYASGLARKGVLATFKHFPGLGTVSADTHLFRATLDEALPELLARDWVPYQQMGESAVMVAHVVVPEIDPTQIASLSPLVVQAELRDRLGHQGLVITDDLCMGPVRHAIGGTRRAGHDALNAGVDLLLISYDSDQYWEVMDGLLAASRAGTLDRGQLERSEERLRTALENRWLVDLHTGSVECAVHQVCK